MPLDQPTPDRRLIGDPLRTTGRHHVLTFNGRQGRRSELTDGRLARFGPRRQLPTGPLDPVAAFGRVAPVVLEIGCGHGAAAVAFAASHPDRDLVAIDVHVPGLARLMAVADEAGVGDNLRVDREDAIAFLVDRLAPGQLAAIHLFFPDPWPKPRHRGRRFVRPDTLDLIADRLAPGGALLVATDQDDYAEHVVHTVTDHGELSASSAPRPDWRPVAGFEAKGLAAGRTITDLRITRAD
ncbi:MAG: tRNA (guanine(46)-N(7))-methyltransferase TrmB [Actinomycetota bacterium]|nr:tRNA (guanine(46)-N(7))-methyltransferase TrmB [Actinomycetota bacterium]